MAEPLARMVTAKCMEEEEVEIACLGVENILKEISHNSPDVYWNALGSIHKKGKLPDGLSAKVDSILKNH